MDGPDRVPDAFCPAIRFCICSDLHIKAPGDEQTRRLRQVMETTYALADAHPTHKTVDAFLFAGDLTNNGTPQQYHAFWDTVQDVLRPETTVLCCVAHNHDNWEFGKGGEKTGLRHFRMITGLTTDTHLCLGGLHFISVSACSKKRRYYSLKQKRWLKRALRQAHADTPNAPVFVMQHEHVRDTVFGSSAFDGWGMTCFRRILSRYPNVVDVSGHSHYPLNDPRSVWQGDFTTIGTGALSYAEFTVRHERKVHPPQCETIAQGWIAEIDRSNTVVLRGYDFLSGTCLCTYVLHFPVNKADAPLTPQRQKARSAPPRFPAGAAMEIARQDGAVTLTWPQAQSGDSFPVFLYHVELQDAKGGILDRADVLHAYWFVHDQPFYTVTLPEHAGGNTVTVWAENAYGMASTPITKEVTFDV
ncbi:MAG: metallophosphoesterase [Clostridia bacterium]|nr:metallophosphoesterase [Clostridia bacterium]